MKKIISISFILASIFSCTEKYTGNQTLSLPSIVIGASDKVSQIESIYDSLEMIMLETNDDILLNGISGVQITDSNIYVMDSKRAIIAKFDTYGNYIKHINWTGKGPKEYLTLFTMKYDPISTKIILSDNFQKKIFILDSDLNIENVISTSFSPTELIACRGNKLVNGQPIPSERGKNKLNYNVLVLDYTGNITDGFIETSSDPVESTTSPYNSFCHLENGDILYHPTLSDTIYTINKDLDCVQPAYYLDFKMKGYEKIDISRYAKEKTKGQTMFYVLSEMERENYTYYWGNIFATDSTILIKCGDRNPLITLYDIAMQNSVSYEANTVKGCGLLKNITVYPKASYKEWLYSAMDYMTLIYICENEQVSNHWKEQIYKLPINSNPVIFRYKIKHIKNNA